MLRGVRGAASRPRRFVCRVATLGCLVAVLAAINALTPITTFAQTATNAPATGITVTGYGEASAPAETATLQLLVTRGDYYGGPPPQPRPGDIPGEEEKRLAAPIVEALVAKGVAETAIAVVVNPVLGSSTSYGPGGLVVARLDVAIENPAQAGISDLISAASVAAAGETLIIGQIGVEYGVADCATLERAAREAAIADARARAAVQADLLGVSLGEVTASTDVPSGTGSAFNYAGIAIPLNGCAPSLPPFTLNNAGLSVTVPPYDPTAETEVEVYAQINLTFAIAA